MSLFDLKPLTMEELNQPHNTVRAYVHGKIRTTRHKPWWMLLGNGPTGQTCGGCQFLTGHRTIKVYYKCGMQNVTHGPGTDIRKKDPACRLFQAITKEGV